MINFLSKFLVITFLFLTDLSLSSNVLANSEIKVLFVGNSYTSGIKNHVKRMLKESPYKNSKFEFIATGSYSLSQHLSNEATIRKIKNGKWDYVVLQEQSQIPSLPDTKKSFFKSVKELSTIIKNSGAKPVLYMTWGRRDGDKSNFKTNPNYYIMQKNLSQSYKKAANDNQILLAPVGDVWLDVYKKLGKDAGILYNDDGSHPSDKGAYLASCVFFRVLFNSSLDFLKVNNYQDKVIKDSVLKNRLKYKTIEN